VIFVPTGEPWQKSERQVSPAEHRYLMAVIATAMGILYGTLFDEDIPAFLPYVATGLLIWNFVNGCILEGSEVFIANEGLIRFLPAPLTLHVYRLVWRQTLFFAHNAVVWVALMIIFPHPLGWSLLLAIPAFLILLLNGAWISVLTGIVATRFRDIPPIIASVANLLFFMTPIVWSYERLRGHPLAAYIELNPVMHFVEILRQPLLGQEILWRHWWVAGAITVVGVLTALLALRNYRSRVAYWV